MTNKFTRTHWRSFSLVIGLLAVPLLAWGYDKNGLVGQWSFEEGGGGVVVDGTGINAPGVIRDQSVSWVEGRHGLALRFTGGSRQVQVPHHDVLNIANGDFTIAFWVRFERVSSYFSDTPLSKHNIDDRCRNNWDSHGWTIFMEAYPLERDARGEWVRDHEKAGPFLRLTDGVHVKANDYPARCSKYKDDIADGKWHHVVFVRGGPDDPSLRYYLNGERVKDNCQIRQPEAIIDNPESPLTFGCRFVGDLDEVLMYSRALSAEEVAALYRYVPPAG